MNRTGYRNDMADKLPDRLQEIVDLFAGGSEKLRTQGLLQYGDRVPPLPDWLEEDRDSLEQVHECQTPFFLHTEVEEDGTVHLHFDAPPEAPTVRGYAGILHAGLDGASAEEVLNVPDDFYVEMGLEEVVSALRLRGMSAIIARMKNQVRERAPAA